MIRFAPSVRSGACAAAAAVMLGAAGAEASPGCAAAQQLRAQGLSTEQIATELGAPVQAVQNCFAPVARPGINPAGRAPVSAAGPAPFGAAGPAPMGAAGPAPMGAAGPAPMGAPGPAPVGGSGGTLPLKR